MNSVHSTYALMPKLIVLAFAYGAIHLAEQFDANYYLICSITFSFITLFSVYTAVRTYSVSLLVYGLVNFIAAVLNYLMQELTYYELFRQFYWYDTFSYVRLIYGVEFIILIKGVWDVFRSVRHKLGSYFARCISFIKNVGSL